MLTLLALRYRLIREKNNKSAGKLTQLMIYQVYYGKMWVKTKQNKVLLQLYYYMTHSMLYPDYWFISLLS